MAHSVWEARAMADVAKETGRATSVSIFNAQTADSRRVIDMVRGGAIGPVHRVDIWTTRASAFWKQGLAHPNHDRSHTGGVQLGHVAWTRALSAL